MSPVVWDKERRFHSMAVGTWAIPVRPCWRPPSTGCRDQATGAKAPNKPKVPAPNGRNAAQQDTEHPELGAQGALGGQERPGGDHGSVLPGPWWDSQPGDSSICWAARWLLGCTDLLWFWEPSRSFLQELRSSLIELDCQMLFDRSGSRIATEVLAGRKHFSAA